MVSCHSLIRLNLLTITSIFCSTDNGKTTQIYDGRKSLDEGKFDLQHTSAEKEDSSGRGEIIYFRDSDDEMPDSDEDPDDDLDIWCCLFSSYNDCWKFCMHTFCTCCIDINLLLRSNHKIRFKCSIVSNDTIWKCYFTNFPEKFNHSLN